MAGETMFGSCDRCGEVRWRIDIDNCWCAECVSGNALGKLTDSAQVDRGICRDARSNGGDKFRNNLLDIRRALKSNWFRMDGGRLHKASVLASCVAPSS